MAKTIKGKQDLDVYTVKGTNIDIKAGDCVLVISIQPNKPCSVALVEKLDADNKGNVYVKVRRYYRPEDAVGGRRSFHGAKELILSDHYDTLSADTIKGKCVVHSFRNYCMLEDFGVKDYYSRYEYSYVTGAYMPYRVPVYCKCELPYNPDNLMLQCDECKEWYHPGCVNLTTAKAKRLGNFVCDACSPDQDGKNSPGKVAGRRRGRRA